MPEIVKGNPVNDPTQKSIKNHSKFTPSFSAPVTHKFGVNTPIFALAGVADDDISVRVTADTDTYTLKAPLMVPLKRNMDYFQLTLRALLPNGAEYLVTNPLTGEDIDPTKVNAVLTPSSLSQLQTKILLGMTTSVSGDLAGANLATNLVKFFSSYQMFQLVCSHGSLPKYLGYSCFSGVTATFSASNSVSKKVPIEKCYSAILAQIDDYLANNEGTLNIGLQDFYTVVNSAGNVTLQYNEFSVKIGRDVTPSRTETVAYFNTVRDFCEYLVESNCAVNSVNISYLSGDPGTNMFPEVGVSWLETAGKIMYGSQLTITRAGYTSSSLRNDINLLRLVAYQKACAEFYTNDKVDAVYSAALWEQNMLAVAYLLGAAKNYSVNGVPVLYDACSGQFLQKVIQSYSGTSTAYTDSAQRIAFIYLHNLFSFTRSLKYEDYFVGSRTQPLAVGDVTVGVDTGDNTVDVIDVSKKIQVQRFLNQVNRIGRKFSDYVKGILGDKPMKDVREPIFLGHVVDTIGAEETDNTGEGQLSLPNSTTSKFRNNADRFAFNVHIGEPSVIIGIVNYDIVRAYSYYNDRENFHVDRYDAFNPFMQFVGDQAIFKDEIIPVPADSNPFAYTLRYMEYKQKVDRAAGGFSLGVLPGYAYVLEPDSIPTNINSDFLRSHVGEINQFYQSLSGYTPAELFNFIVRLDIDVTANRPMAFAPSIL